MSVSSKFRDFFSRHRNKFIFGGVFITGSILLTKYAQQKLKDWQEREAREFLERSRKQQHFESTERTCNQTILSLISTLNESLAKVVNTEQIIADLRNNPENKIQLWENLKFMVFTRASSLIYVSVMLVIALRVQLNILGGHLFKDVNSISQELIEKYLSLCHNLLDDGIKSISTLVEKQYERILGPLELKKQLSLKDLENIFWAIQSTVATSDLNPINTFSAYIVGIERIEEGSAYKELIQDTVDILDSDEVKRLANHCINRGFVMLNDQLAEYYTADHKIEEIHPNTATNGFVHPSDIQIPLAKLIPIINGLFAKNALPDHLIQKFIVNDKIKVLGANIYESFSYKK